MIDRRNSIGASEVAALFGCNPYQSEYGLWLLKTGLAPEQEDTERLRAGRYLERAVLAEWQQRNPEIILAWNNETRAHASYPFITATPDAIGIPVGDSVDVVGDVKTVTRERRADWKWDLPTYYQLQLQQQMLVTGALRGVIIAQFGFDELGHAWIDRDAEIQEEIIKRCVTFWKRVQGELPPPEVDAHPATTAALKRRNVQAKAIELSSDVRDWSDRLANVERYIKQNEAEAQDLRNKIRAAMGDASMGLFIDGSGWAIRQQPESEFTVKKKAHTVMRRIKNRDAVEGEE